MIYFHAKLLFLFKLTVKSKPKYCVIKYLIFGLCHNFVKVPVDRFVAYGVDLYTLIGHFFFFFVLCPSKIMSYRSPHHKTNNHLMQVNSIAECY